MEINFTSQIWREGKMYVAYAPELDISSCGKSASEAEKNLHEAVEIFLEETKKMGTLNDILEEAGFRVKKSKNKIYWTAPEIISIEKAHIVF